MRSMRRLSFIAALVFISLYGCSSGEDSPIGGDGGDLVSDIGDSTNDAGSSTKEYAFIVNAAPDYSSGSFSIMDLKSKNIEKNKGVIHSDAIARVYGNLIYVVNRLGADNITVIDPGSNYSIVKQFSVGGGTNPQDVVVYKDKIFVTLQLSNKILIYDSKSYEKIGEIDTSSYADGDGSSEPGEMILAGDKLYITILRLDKNNFYNPTDKSYLLAINPSNGNIEKGIQLGATNPFAGLTFDKENSRVIIGETGSFGSKDGRVEFLDIDKDIISEYFIPESEWGGDLNRVTYAKNKIVAIVSDENYKTALKVFDIGSSKFEKVYETAGFYLAGASIYNESEIYLCDRTKEMPGIRIFDLLTYKQKTTDPLDTGLPPISLVFFSR